MNPLTQIIEEKDKDFEEKFDTINTTLVSMTTGDGFVEQVPAVKATKLHITSLSRALLEGVLQVVGPDEPLDDEYSDEERAFFLTLETDLRTPEHIRERRFGRNQSRQRIRTVIEEAISNLK